MKRLFFSFLLLACGFFTAGGEVIRIYMSPTGHDGNTGAKDRPVASLTGARDLIRSIRGQKLLTDTIYVEVAPGEYYQNEPLALTSPDAGTAQSPVVFRGQPNVRTVIYGGRKTGRFEVVQPGLWRVFIPEAANYGMYFEQLYVNGERRFRAQTPNRGFFNMVKRTEETAFDTVGERMSSFTVQKVALHADGTRIINEIESKEWNDVLVVFYHNWDNTRKRISHINGRDTAFFFVGQGMKPWNKINENSRYVVENYRKALDAPGEWYLQRDGYLYYIPMPGETIENTWCMYPLHERFISIEGKAEKPVEHIRFENLAFEVTAYHTPAKGNDPMQAAASVEATVMIDFARHIDFINCTLAHTGLHGIWYRKACFDSKITHCHLYDLGGGAVKIGNVTMTGSRAESPDTSLVSRFITIDNNILQHGGNIFPCAVGVTIFHGSDNRITHNDIADFRYSGISAGWVWGYGFSPSKRNTIDFNHIHHLGWGELSDMGGVYTLGKSEGTTVSNNHIHHIYSFSYGGWGLYTDEGSTGIVMENNLVYACKNAGFHQHYGKENIIRNNIFAFIRKSAVEISKVEEHLSYTFTNNIIYQDKGGFVEDVWGRDNGTKIIANFDHNCYWKAGAPPPGFYGLSFAEWKKLGRDKNSIIADPLFVDPDKFDFRLKNASTARKIKFKPFDYTQAGVYGCDEWKAKARLCTELEKEFDTTVSRYEAAARK